MQLMTLMRSTVRVGLCGALFTWTACGGERNDGSQRAAAGPDTARPQPAGDAVRARATISGPPGSDIKGEVTLTELEGGFPVPGVQIEARISGPSANLAPGSHGFHIHETASGGCVPPYTSTGGHFDPGPAGNTDPDVNHPFHLGDIPNLVVDSSGVGTLRATTSRITLSPGPLSVFDKNGSSIIVHEEADQGISGPAKSGVSGGPRIACGVIERDSAPS